MTIIAWFSFGRGGQLQDSVIYICRKNLFVASLKHIRGVRKLEQYGVFLLMFGVTQCIEMM